MVTGLGVCCQLADVCCDCLRAPHPGSIPLTYSFDPAGLDTKLDLVGVIFHPVLCQCSNLCGRAGRRKGDSQLFLRGLQTVAHPAPVR